jgi:prevent-host-death family protein
MCRKGVVFHKPDNFTCKLRHNYVRYDVNKYSFLVLEYVMQTVDIKNIKPLTEFRNHMKEYIKELNVHKKPIILTQHGKSAAVLLDVEKFQEIQDQIDFMRKVAIGIDDLKNNRIHSLSEVINDIDSIISNAANK